MTILGDPHNFGRCVELCQDGRIFKPRNLVWENELLCATSRLRTLFVHLAEKNSNPYNPFRLFPDLKFWFEPDSLGMKEGFVECIQWRTPDYSFSPIIFESIGEAIAFLCWMGVGDLHRDNMAFGRTQDDKVIFSPLDVETIFNNFTLPSQTLLISSQKVPPDKCGLYEIFKIINYADRLDLIGALCRGYLVGLSFFEKYGVEIERNILSWEDILETPVRVFPRSTAEYRRLQSSVSDISVADSEAIQIQRGDIPFFFRKISNSDIHFYDCKEISKKADLLPSLENCANAHVRLLEGDRFASRNLEILKKAGVLQLARFFLGSWVGNVTYKDLTLCRKERLIIVWRDFLRLQCAA
ncbi:MAG: hypothetical protein Q7T03_05370 [Deltaproteobacteria bacterium]|nr:hypothetical protein [Deltaproteobacteria bacterium]